MNLTEIAKIDVALSDQGVRIPVYAQTDLGKIEFFLDGYRDFEENAQGCFILDGSMAHFLHQDRIFKTYPYLKVV